MRSGDRDPQRPGDWSALSGHAGILLEHFEPSPVVDPGQTQGGEHLSGKRVLITGAGGSIGSALARAVWALRPASLILFDSSEHGLYEVERSLGEPGRKLDFRSDPTSDLAPLLGSVCDRPLLTRLFAEHRPQIVYHAAACKHVPLTEQNPCAAILNNSAGTLTLRRVAERFGAEALVLVSTDKAADPVSIMGASKRVAERVLLARRLEHSADLSGDRPEVPATRCVAVRLGNVAGSQGSVLPLFREQIARGGPVTVTHPEARRYFMTIEQAVAALLAAPSITLCPALVIPELGEPVAILKLARELVQDLKLAGAGVGKPDPVEIVFTGLRPGDKLCESLLSANERWGEPAGAGLRRVEPAGLKTSLECGLDDSELEPARPDNPAPANTSAGNLRSDRARLDAAVDRLSEAACNGDLAEVLKTLAAIVPEYRPSALIRSRLAAAASVTAPTASSAQVSVHE